MITRYALLSLFFTCTALAQGPLLPDRQEAYKDWYTVELIVFEQNAASCGVPPPHTILPNTTGAVELEQLFATQSATATSNAPPLPPESGFLPVPADEYQLTDVYQHLQRAAGYRPIVHLAWRQHATSFGDTTPVHVHGGQVLDTYMPNILDQAALGNDPSRRSAVWPEPVALEEISGTAMLSMGNVPQLRLDLVFRTAPQFNPLKTTARQQTVPRDRFDTWHLREHRAMRPGALHYFDHRRFGVIATLTPYQPEPAQLHPVEPPRAIPR